MKYFSALTIILILNITVVQKNIEAQNVYFDFGFEKDFSVVVSDSLGNPYDYAWAGGLNNCLMYEIDLNLDNIKDLFCFDRIGNRMLTFINNGTANMTDYTFAPQYAYYLQQYPPIEEWVILKDFNCDGKEDIITHCPAGMSIYKNVSDTVLKFQLYTYMLQSFYYSSLSNLYVTSVDLPGIADLDGDGDLDILAFWGLGVWVHYHKNLAMENYGKCDTMDFKLTNECWGDFSEHAYTNVLNLNDSCPFKSSHPVPPVLNTYEKGGTAKHTGSTMLLLDLDNDSLLDLILGDVDYPNPIALYNKGTKDSAHIVYQDTLFPSNTTGINITSFPSLNYLDIDNDGIKEMVASPFDPNPYLTENYNNIWLYENSGTNNAPLFTLSKKNFMQGEMIDVGGGAYPVFFDYNNDGLEDLVVGNYGYLDTSFLDEWLSLHSYYRSGLALYENTGTRTNPQFRLITRDYANLSTLYPDTMPITAIYPAFGDLDGDGDKDMLIGNKDGKLHYFTNTAATGAPANFQLSQMNYKNIDAGDFSAPQLIDLDRDGRIDLVLGEKHGNLIYYRNTGTTSIPEFTHVTDSLGYVNATNINVSYNGFSIPCFFEDTVGVYSLFVGTEYGYVEYYKDIDGNLNGTFTRKDSLGFILDSVYHPIMEGLRVSPAVYDLDSNGYVELLVGNFSGGISYFKGITPPDISVEIEDVPEDTEISIELFPNPADNQINVVVEGITANVHMDISFFNLLSKKVFSKSFYGQKLLNIDTSSLSPGMYICTLTIKGRNERIADKTISKKFIIR